MIRIPLTAVVLLALALSEGRPVAQSGHSQASHSFSSGATAILVDVVVRDRQGRPVLDLAAQDFEISEDGVRQRVDSFTRVSRGGGIGVGVAWRTGGTSTLVTPPSLPTSSPVESESEGGGTMALVFDHLSAESLRLAQRATLEYLPMNGDAGVQMGVFATGTGFRIAQHYTTDLALIRRAVRNLVPSGTSAEEQKADRTGELMARRREIDQAGQVAARAAATTGGAAAGVASGELGQLENERRLVQTELNMIRAFESLDRDHQGYDTSRALLEIAESLAELPGRKTIVFFSEGLPVSPGLSARLDAVIAAANRAHVTTYAIDAHGLRTRSSNAQMLKEVNAFVEERTMQLTSGSDATNEPLTMGFERVEDTFKLDSRTGLARLAEDTGGFLVEESNDLSTAFRRIDEDNRFHYLLTYSPTNTNFDGKFRTIGVKVRRQSVRVFARKGYRAVRSAASGAGGSYEAPALALLGRTPLPRAFPVGAAAFSFPEPERPGLTPIVVRFSTAVLRYDVDQARASYSAQAAVVVRIRDSNGREVEKLSQEYLLSGAEKDLEAARRGEILFYREPELSSGVYTIESIVFDGKAEQGSARIATLTVPALGSSLAMSSLVLVSRAEEVSERPGGVAPFYVGRTLLYPNVGQPISKAVAAELPFYFCLYGRPETAAVSVQLLRNGEVLADAPLRLPAAANSRVQYVGKLPVSALPAGTYELRIRVIGGGTDIARAAFFTLE